MVEKLKEIEVPKAWHGLNIDKALCLGGLKYSRREIRRILDQGGLLVNGQKVFTASFKVKEGQLISFLKLSAPKERRQAFKLTAQDIVWEDAHYIAINKPAHLPSQQTKSNKGTHAILALNDFLRQRVKMQDKEERQDAMLCHRLDKETTGILLFGKSKKSAALLMEMFKEKTIEKTYLAVCVGICKESKWQQKNFLSDIDQKTGLVKIVRSGGKTAVTDFTLLATDPNLFLSLIECKPQTGRSHQLRVQLSTAKIPILGDKKYGAQAVELALSAPILKLAQEHQLLHAWKISFVHPYSKKKILLSAQLPVNLLKVLKLSKLGMNFLS